MNYFIGIGVNKYNEKAYGGNVDLKECVRDVENWISFLKEKKAEFNIKTFFDNEATISDVFSYLIPLVLSLKKGDLLIVVFSGHGVQVFDKFSTDVDKLNECFCFHDGLLTDKEINNKVWRSAPKGASVAVFSDMCHSGDSYRALNYVVQKKRIINKNLIPKWLSNWGLNSGGLKANFQFFNACQSNQLADELPGLGGRFTYELLKEARRKSNNWYKTFKNAKATMPIYQSPEYKAINGNDTGWSWNEFGTNKG